MSRPRKAEARANAVLVALNDHSSRTQKRAAAGLEEPPVTGEESLHILKSIFSFYEAARTGRAQTV